MRLLNFFSRLFKRKSVPPGSGTEAARRDFSLRPDPATYLDQRNESTTVLNRIHSSSSSVIGIAGVRGAGKSSLAFKLLDTCGKSGYFTLLIHSPTGYEPREFLLSVFQRICEATINRLERLFGQEQTVEGRGRAQLRRSRQMATLLMIGAFAVVILSAGYSYYRLDKFRTERQQIYRQRRASERKHFVDEINKTFSDVSKAQTFLENCAKKPDACTHLRKEISMLSESRKNALLRLAKLSYEDFVIDVKGTSDDSDSEPIYDTIELFLLDLRIDRYLMGEEDVKYIVTQLEPEQLPPVYQAQRTINAHLKSVFAKYENITASEETGEDFASKYASETLLMIVMVGVGYVGFIGIFLAARRVQRQITLEKKYPRETGLYQLARETLEHLKYQTTMTSSQDASVSIWKLATKFVRTKQLETRPVSMPGLTADCNAFIDKVAEVFGGKSVICLDELDKIIDPKQLEELLTGVKGILGQNRSHFILTVSEDALARFATRRRTERDIIESSFDEIISLNRVSFQVARHIVCKMLAVTEPDAVSDRLNKNILLAWIFGGGIPREIKRNVITAADAFDFVNGDPRQLWDILFSNLRDALKSWALIASADEDISYDFLVCLEKMGGLRSPDQNPKEWYKALTGLWSNYFKLPFVEPEAEPKSNGDKTKPETARKNHSEKFERAIFELMIGAYALLLTDDKAKLEDFPTDRLLDVFTLFVYSPSFAAFKFHSLLSEAGIVERQADVSARLTENS
jgi:hypothetical protein